MRPLGNKVVRGLVFLIQLYRHMVSPLRPATCRFIPTCSQYAVDALTEHGLIRGSWLAAARLVKCGPWHPGGWDPIPEPLSKCDGGDGRRPREARESPTPRGEDESFAF